MAVTISSIVTLARLRIIEQTASFWTDDELVQICIAGVRDLWRDIVDLKQEHYLKRNDTDVFLDASTPTLRGVPNDVHKVYLIEPVDSNNNSGHPGLAFLPRDYNHRDFIAARTLDAVDAASLTIYYAITGQGAPVNAPVIYCAPMVTSQVAVSFVYVPSLGDLTANSFVPIPGEADNALVAWVVAFARSKEREDRSPDENWLAIYATEKQHLLQSLGLRQYQEPMFVDALFEQYWG